MPDKPKLAPSRSKPLPILIDPLKIAERSLHSAVCDLLDLVLVPPDWWTLFPAGGGGSTWQSLRGLKLGVPDLLIVHEGRAFWIELKTETGKLEPRQADTIADLGLAGAKAAICRSIEDVIRTLIAWQIPIRKGWTLR